MSYYWLFTSVTQCFWHNFPGGSWRETSYLISLLFYPVLCINCLIWKAIFGGRISRKPPSEKNKKKNLDKRHIMFFFSNIDNDRSISRELVNGCKWALWPFRPPFTQERASDNLDINLKEISIVIRVVGGQQVTRL